MSALSVEYRNVMDNREWHVVYKHVRTVRPLTIRIQCDRDSMLMQLVSADAAGSCSAEATVRRLAAHPRCVGIGERDIDLVKKQSQ